MDLTYDCDPNINGRYAVQEARALLQEETPLVPSKYRHSLYGSRTNRLCLLVAVIILLITVATVVTLSAAITLQISDPEGRTVKLVTQNDSSLLGIYKLSPHEKATVSMVEVVENEDAFHENYYTIVPTSKVLVHMELFKENNSIVPLVDNAIAVNQRYIYMLRNSILKYTICLGNATKRSNTTLYVFNSEEAYNNYVGFSSSSSGSVFMKDFLIGGHGEIVCGNISFTSNENGYYFVVLKTKYASTYVNYTVEAKLNRLSINDYLRKYSSCRVDQDKTSCSLSFDSSNREWSLIGYSSPNYDFNSHLNHVCVSIIKQRKAPWDTVYGILVFGGIGIVGGCFLLLIVTSFLLILAIRRKRTSSVLIY